MRHHIRDITNFHNHRRNYNKFQLFNFWQMP